MIRQFSMDSWNGKPYYYILENSPAKLADIVVLSIPL